MARTLNDLGQGISETVIMSKILSSLPSKFLTFRSAWNSVAPERQTIAYLEARLIEEEAILIKADEGANALAATLHQNKPKKGGKNSSGKTQGKPNNRKPRRDVAEVTCFVCGKKGHYARTCRERHGRSPNSQNNEGKQTQDFQPFKDHALAAEAISSESKLSSRRIPSTSCERERQILQANVSDIWLTDSGASAHITFRREWFSEFHPRRDGSSIALGDTSQYAVAGISTIPIVKWVNEMWIESCIQNVLYVPEFNKNLLSVGVCTSRGMEWNFKKDHVTLYLKGELIATGVKQSNLVYRMHIYPKLKAQVEAYVASLSLKTWHERLGHVNKPLLKELVKKDLLQ